MEIKCPAPPKVEHGKYTCASSTRHKLNDTCHLQCLTGYKPNNSRSDITCLSSDHWSTPDACIVIKCPDPPSVVNGNYTCSSTTHKLNDTCQLQCSTGYKPKSIKSDINCMETEKWSSSTACEEITCPSPPTVTHGTYRCPSTTHRLNDVCHLHCTSGYKPSTTQSKITCGTSDTWSAPASCIEIKCPAPPSVTNGHYTCGSSPTHKLDDICHLQCSTGYKPSNTTSDIKCLDSEKWSPLTACEEITCPSPPTVTHGTYRCQSTSHRLHDVCHLHCTSGYKPNTTQSKITCGASETWSTPASCIEIKCPAPQSVTNGHYKCDSSPTNKLNDICHLQCSTGYKPSNTTSDIKCLDSEKWSPLTACEEITCPSPPTVTHGTYICPSTTHRLNDVCQLHCTSGYKPSTKQSKITCGASDTWSAPASCIEIKCPVPPKVLNGHYTCSSSSVHKLNDVCHLHCASGYKLSTLHSNITCGASDTWSASASCKEIHCPAPPMVEHGTYMCGSSTTHKMNDTCHLQCSTGYKPNNQRSDITCLSSEKWSKAESCIEIQCSAPPKVEHGTYSCGSSTSHKLNDTCHLQCSTGYKPNNQRSDITCLSSEQWSKAYSCIEIRCPVPTLVTNGKYTCASSTTHKLNDVCHLQCSTGYKPRSTTSDIRCLDSEKWSPPTACEEITCNTLPKVMNGNYSCPSSKVQKLNDVCHLQCASGYKPSKQHSQITCQASDSWSTPASCIEIKCPSPTKVIHGSYKCDSSTHKLNDVCHLHCASGYKSSTPSSHITCQASDKWSTPDYCIAKACPDPPKVTNGIYKCPSTSHRLNDTCQLQCSIGYKFSTANSDIKCLSTEKWSTTTASCDVIQCSAPTTPHGSYHCSSTLHTPGSTCSLTCDTGFTTSRANTEIVCSSSSKWSSPPTCEEIRCQAPPSVNHGSYNCSSTVHKPGSTCSLTCDKSYTAIGSETTIVCSSSSKWSSSPTCEAVPTTTRTTTTSTTTTTTVTSPTTTTTTTTTSTTTTTKPTTTTTDFTTTTPPPTTSAHISVYSAKGLSTGLPASATATESTTATSNVASTTSTAMTRIETTTGTTSASTPAKTRSSTTVSTTAAPLSCEVCSGSLCGLIPGNDPVIQCPGKTPYCLNHVDNDSTGSKTVTKSCAGEDECNRRWWHETSDKSNCVDFNPTNIYNYQLSCTYCCTKPGCNKDIVPARHTLFIGHD